MCTAFSVFVFLLLFPGTLAMLWASVIVKDLMLESGWGKGPSIVSMVATWIAIPAALYLVSFWPAARACMPDL